MHVKCFARPARERTAGSFIFQGLIDFRPMPGWNTRPESSSEKTEAIDVCIVLAIIVVVGSFLTRLHTGIHKEKEDDILCPEGT